MTTRIHAIQAEDAFTDSNPVERLARSFTIRFAEMATAALGAGFSDPPDGKPAQYTKRCAQRADKPTIETGYPQIQKYRDKKDHSNQPNAIILHQGRRPDKTIKKPGQRNPDTFA
jgi:hypothetical protein